MRTPSASSAFDRTERTLTASFVGELDQDTAPDLTSGLLDQLRPDDEDLWLDLSAVSFCGSAGISALIQIQRHADRDDIRLTLRNPSAVVKATIAVCGLHEVFRVRNDTASTAAG